MSRLFPYEVPEDNLCRQPTDITPPREDLDKSLHGLELQAPTFDPALYEDEGGWTIPAGVWDALEKLSEDPAWQAMCAQPTQGAIPLCPPEPLDFSL